MLSFPHLFRAFAFLFLTSITAFAADLNGRWILHLGGPDGPDINYTFKVSGTQFTGSSESPFGPGEVRDGRIDGTNLTFVVVAPDGSTIEIRGKIVSDDELSLEAVGYGPPGKAVRAPSASAAPPEPPAPAPMTRTHTWLQDRAVGQRPFTAYANKLPLISVSGNHFVDPQGKTVLFRGLCVADPDKIDLQGHWNRDLFVKAKEMGATIVRLPVHPAAWRQRTPAEYLKLLDQAVFWCSELDLYVMIDWHSIGNLVTGIFQDPMYDTTREETFNFWRVMARHYAGHHTVAFFELFNEPTNGGAWATTSYDMQQWLDTARKGAPNNIVLVGTPNWNIQVGDAADAPLDGSNVMYVSHMYPRDFALDFVREQLLNAAAKVPVFMTEWGFQEDASGDPANEKTNGTIHSFAIPLKQLVDEQRISWTAWSASATWQPPMFDADGALRVGEGEMGGFVKDCLYEQRHDGVPTP